MSRENFSNVDFAQFDIQQPESPIRGRPDTRRVRRIDHHMVLQPSRYEIGDSEARIDPAIWRMLLDYARLSGVECAFEDMAPRQANDFGNAIRAMLDATSAVLKIVAKNRGLSVRKEKTE